MAGKQGAHIVLRVPRGVIVRDALEDMIGNALLLLFQIIILSGASNKCSVFGIRAGQQSTVVTVTLLYYVYWTLFNEVEGEAVALFACCILVENTAC